MSPREAYRQGYVRGMMKTMDAIHTAFRKRMATGDIEDLLRRMAAEASAEADAFEEWRRDTAALKGKP